MYKKKLKLEHNNISISDFKIQYSNTINSQDFCLNLHNILKKYKDFIDNIDISLWDFYKKKTNDFELIEKKKNLTCINPISRAYFKLYEIIKEYNLIKEKKPIKIVGLAEGPGGFIQCMYDLRNRKDDKYVCMSLFSENNTIPGWNKNFNFKKKNIDIFYGYDNTGNLYNYKNILSLKNKINNVDIVTCDGGFNYSINYNKQEQLSYRLILSQVISSLNILKIKGTMIIKIFDIFTQFTLKIIYFLTTLFNSVTITKPYTSRMGNSEKYLVCQDFKGIDSKVMIQLIDIIRQWDILQKKNLFITDIFTMDVPSEFQELIYSYNYIIVYNQIKNILKTLIYLKIKFNNNYIYDRQKYYALEWCKKFNIKNTNI